MQASVAPPPAGVSLHFTCWEDLMQQVVFQFSDNKSRQFEWRTAYRLNFVADVPSSLASGQVSTAWSRWCGVSHALRTI